VVEGEAKMSIYDLAEKMGLDRKSFGLALWFGKWLLIFASGIGAVVYAVIKVIG